MEKHYFLLPTDKWEAVKQVRSNIVCNFDPGVWALEFFADGKVTIYLEGDRVGTYDYTFIDGMLSIAGRVPKKAYISDSIMIIHDTDLDDGTPYYTVYRRLQSGPVLFSLSSLNL